MTVKKRRIYNLNLAKDKDALYDTFDDNKLTTLSAYLKGESSSIRYGNVQLLDADLADDGTILVMPDNRVYFIDRRFDCSEYCLSMIRAELVRIRNRTHSPDAIIINTKHNERFGNSKRILLANGDDDTGGVLVGMSGTPTTSFACLQRFYKKNEYLQRLQKGYLKIVDYTDDECRELSAKDRKILRSDKTPTPPEAGFTIVGTSWHRSGTVLFQDTKRILCIMTGQDEGTFFGVQLPKMVSTITKAYKILIPKEVTGNFTRQGEWFMVGVNDAPEFADCVAISDDHMILPKDSADSNSHCITSTDIRVDKSGRIFAYSPTVEHDQHAAMRAFGWQTFFKNTAVQAFSQEGVD